jgi:hypothetical protein
VGSDEAETERAGVSVPYLFVGAPSGGEGHHALFAARIRHWPPKDLADHVWVDWDEKLQVQLNLLQRHLRFITALHPGEAALQKGHRPTLAIRYFSEAESAYVECALLGKAYGAAAEAARANAEEWWETVATLMPVGYELVPAQTEAEYGDWSGASVARYAAEQKQWAEVRRAAEFLLWSDESQPPRYLPIVHPYRWEASAWDAVWMALGRVVEPAMVSVSLRPTTMAAPDELVLADLLRDLLAVSETARPPLSTYAAEAVEWYQHYLRGLRAPFEVRVSVLGAPAVRWAVRSALSGHGWSAESGAASAHTVLAEIAAPNDSEFTLAQSNLTFLEHDGWGPNPWGRARMLPAIERLRYLADAPGALCAFRLPLLPPAGLPGVTVGEEIQTGK